MNNKVQKDKGAENEEKIHIVKGPNKWVEFQKEWSKRIGHKQYMKSYPLRNYQNSLVRHHTTNSRGFINPKTNKHKGIDIWLKHKNKKRF